MITKLLINEYLTHLAAVGKSDNTIKNYTHSLRVFEDWLGDREIQNLKLIHTYEYQVYLNNKITEAKPTTIYLYLIALKTFLTFCQKNGVRLAVNPEHMEMPKIPDFNPTYLTKDEISALFASIPESRPQDHLMIKLLYTTGIRVSELSTIRAEDIDLSSKQIRIKGKGGRVRLVFLTDEVCELIRRHGVLSGYLFRGRVSKTPHYTITQIGLIVKKYARLAGITKTVTPHVLRHSLATILLKNGANVRIVQELLGHRSIETTARYTHFCQSELQDAHLKYLTI